VIRLKGKMSGREFVREIAVDFPEAEAQHNVLSSLWARQRIDDLMGQDYSGAQRGEMKPEIKETITNLGLEYRLMTQFTSFVAVEEMIVTDGGQPRRIDVPVEVPEGVNREAVDASRGQGGATGFFTTYSGSTINSQNFSFSRGMSAGALTKSGTGSKPKASSRRGSGGGGGVGSGSAGGSGGPAGGAIPAPNAPPALAVNAAVIVAEDESVKVYSPVETKRAALEARLHPSLLAVVDRLKNKAAAGVDEAKFVRDGKAEVQVWLTDKSAESLAALKALGFEVVLDPKTAKVVIGRLPIEKLEALAELKFIRYVSPQISSR
jgi:hypothetical protein